MKNKEFWIAAGIRARRTFCQAAIGAIGSAVLMEDVDWKKVLSASILSALCSLLMSGVTGLPEVEKEGE